MATASPSAIALAKEAAGKKAAELIEDGMLVGLGSGSTAACFIESLAVRCRAGLKIKAIAASESSRHLAEKGGIPLLAPMSVHTLDITVDGADEIDRRKRMIKGGGGALLREKILASMSKEMVVVIDEGKLVPLLGKFPLAVEVAPFAYGAAVEQLGNKGYAGKMRMAGSDFYLTDNGNFIFDILFDKPLENPEYHEAVIRRIPGILDTGFFFHLAGRVIVGYYDGRIEILP